MTFGGDRAFQWEKWRILVEHFSGETKTSCTKAYLGTASFLTASEQPRVLGSEASRLVVERSEPASNEKREKV